MEEVTMTLPVSPSAARDIGEEEVRLEEESEDFAVTVVGDARSPHEEGEGRLSESEEDRERSSGEEVGAESEGADEVGRAASPGLQAELKATCEFAAAS